MTVAMRSTDFAARLSTDNRIHFETRQTMTDRAERATGTPAPMITAHSSRRRP